MKVETVYKDAQISQVSKHLNIPKTTVYQIFTAYVDYLKGKIDKGETVKFLDVCYLRVNGKDEQVHETLAYISHELADSLKLSHVVVYRVLTTYSEFLIRDLKKLNSYSIRGLIRIKLEKNYKGEYKVRTKKSTVYNGKDVYVTTTNFFKRKAEVLA